VALPTQHRELMAQDENLDVLGRSAAGEQPQPTKHRGSLYRSTISRVPLTCGFGDDEGQTRSAVVCLRLLYLIMVCLFRWLTILARSESVIAIELLTLR
jgi:hypothetical protein